MIIYLEFLLLIKKGFTLAILDSFKKKKKLLYKELVKVYANGRGAKWILIDRLKVISKVKIMITTNVRINVHNHRLYGDCFIWSLMY